MLIFFPTGKKGTAKGEWDPTTKVTTTDFDDLFEQDYERKVKDAALADMKGSAAAKMRGAWRHADGVSTLIQQ